MASLKATEGLLKGLSDSSNALEAEVGGGDLVLLLIAGLPSVNISMFCFILMHFTATTMTLSRSCLLFDNEGVRDDNSECSEFAHSICDRVRII